MHLRLYLPFLERGPCGPMLYSTLILDLVRQQMDAFEISEIIAQHRREGRPYHEFFRTENLSLGLYVLPAGEKDPQAPHTEEEVYYVLEGQGMVKVDDEDRPVSAGSTVFVGVGVEHRFHSITQDLKLLVFWAPPLRSQAPPN